MNPWQKCKEMVSKQKVVTICLSFIITFLLFVLIICLISPPLPKSVDMEIRRNSNALRCERRSCLLDWVRKYQSNANLSEMHQICSRQAWVARINESFKLYQEKKVDWQFLQGVYHYYWIYFCNDKCSIDGPFRFFQAYHSNAMQTAKAVMQNVFCIARYNTSDSCRWRGYSIIFKIYFSYFSIPITVILNYVNLSTLLQLLGDGAGAALYLHTAEIVTDCLLNIVVGVNRCLYIFISLDQWRGSCGFYQYSSVFECMSVVRRCLTFINQAFSMGLVADRLHALTNPYQYNDMTDAVRKRRAKSIVLKILLGSFTLYFPFIIFRTFRPTFLYWVKVSDFWKANLNRIDFAFSTFYVVAGFTLLMSQIICGVFVEKKFRKFIKNKTELTQESEIKLKKRERDKQLLLVGTIGLNVITGLISAAFNIANTTALYELLGYSSYRPWWSLLFYMADPVLTFINGNGALVIHILTVKSYRRAFKATRLGRLLFHSQVHPA